jgi:hypothetical protein
MDGSPSSSTPPPPPAWHHASAFLPCQSSEGSLAVGEGHTTDGGGGGGRSDELAALPDQSGGPGQSSSSSPTTRRKSSIQRTPSFEERAKARPLLRTGSETLRWVNLRFPLLLLLRNDL